MTVPPSNPRVLVFGTGSLGTVYASILHSSNIASVTCVCRSNYNAAVSNGFTVESQILYNGTFTFRPSIVASVLEAAAALLEGEDYDFILVCTKAFPGIAPLIRDVVGPSTALVVVQNGLGVEREWKELYPQNTVISGVAYCPTTQIGPAIVRHTEVEKLEMGLYPAPGASSSTNSSPPSEAQQSKLQIFADLIKKGGATSVISPDIQLPRWRKLIANGTWNPICALSRCRDVEFLSTSLLAEPFVHAVMAEICSIASALGYGAEINTGAARFQFGRTQARTAPGVQPSMMADMLIGSRMEVQAVLGEMVSIASDKKLAVPRLETLYVLLSGLDHALARERAK